MAGQPSRKGEQLALDAMSGRASTTAPGTMYLALCTTAPTDTALGTELTTPGTNGYDREIVAWDATVAGDPSVIDNTSQITFGPFTADLGIVTHIMLMDVSTGGTAADNMFYWWAVDTSKDPANGDSITIAAGALSMSAD